VSRWFDSDVITPASIGTLLDDPIVECDKARKELGHAPRPIEDTVRDTVRWFEGETEL
jgi:nucleoside-diphosphate-sugar epimerase